MSANAYAHAMTITDQAQADRYFAQLVACLVELGLLEDEAREQLRHDLGYWTGYCPRDVAERAEKLYACAHPILGSVEARAELSPEEMIALGLKGGVAGLRSVLAIYERVQVLSAMIAPSG
jgi:hypothetical protein